mmetsp:Transcript_8108/g.12256  ORF Transcript_8108/g.12256 Transcript_8108/m.12256 type:complete len:230 (-) Transcript_8108:1041-1730(-)
MEPSLCTAKLSTQQRRRPLNWLQPSSPQQTERTCNRRRGQTHCCRRFEWLAVQKLSQPQRLLPSSKRQRTGTGKMSTHQCFACRHQNLSSSVGFSTEKEKVQKTTKTIKTTKTKSQPQMHSPRRPSWQQLLPSSPTLASSVFASPPSRAPAATPSHALFRMLCRPSKGCFAKGTNLGLQSSRLLYWLSSPLQLEVLWCSTSSSLQNTKKRRDPLKSSRSGGQPASKQSL